MFCHLLPDDFYLLSLWIHSIGYFFLQRSQQKYVHPTVRCFKKTRRARVYWFPENRFMRVCSPKLNKNFQEQL